MENNITNYIIKYFFKKYDGDWEKISNAIKQKEEIKPDIDFKNTFDNTLTINNDLLIKKFKNSKCVPFIFWCKGNVSLLNKKTFLINNSFDFNRLENIDFKKYVPVINLEFIEKRFIEMIKNKNINYIGVIKKINETNDNNLVISWMNPKYNVDKFFVVDEQDKLNKLCYSLCDYYSVDLEQDYILNKYNISCKKVNYDFLYKELNKELKNEEKITKENMNLFWNIKNKFISLLKNDKQK